MTSRPPDVVLPCGCLLSSETRPDGDYDAKLTACSDLCVNVRILLLAADRTNMPVEIRVL